MKTINVEMSVLIQAANYIDEINNEFKNHYNQLNNDVDILQMTWLGKDNLAFTTKIKGYNDDFNKMSLTLSQYSSFLNNTAKAYEQTQNELVNQVNRLQN